ncbi:hypothetical protein P9112_005212 [Eukaryota sp. TZLM1-RC]
MSAVCQTSFRGDQSNPPLYIISNAMSTPSEDVSSSVPHSTQETMSSGVTHLIPNSFCSGEHPIITITSGDPCLPPPNANLTLSEVTPPNQNAHPTATTALSTANVSQDKPAITSPELAALIAVLIKEKMEKQEPTDFVKSLSPNTSLYQSLENCVSVQTLNETLKGFREVPLTPQVLKGSKELLDQESNELSGRPAERRIKLSP